MFKFEHCYLFLQITSFVLCLLIASVAAEQRAEDVEAVVEQNDFVINEDSGYKFNYKTSNSIKAEEEGDGVNIVEGSYSYLEPDTGRTVVVTYTAGAGIGFNPIGNVVHPQVAAAVERNLKNPKEV